MQSRSLQLYVIMAYLASSVLFNSYQTLDFMPVITYSHPFSAKVSTNSRACCAPIITSKGEDEQSSKVEDEQS